MPNQDEAAEPKSFGSVSTAAPKRAAKEPETKEPEKEPEFVVGLPFNSEYRRHCVGDPITRAELEKSRLDFDHLVDGGFIVENPTVNVGEK